jgi:hypothetical protein
VLRIEKKSEEKEAKNNICIAGGKRSCTCQPTCRLSRGREGRQGITSGGVGGGGKGVCQTPRGWTLASSDPFDFKGFELNRGPPASRNKLLNSKYRRT